MNIKKILLAVVILMGALVSWMLLRNKEDIVGNNSIPTVSSESTVSPSPVALKNVITYTDSGFTPGTITIKKGEIVVWKNESINSMWTASAMHPTHKAYPGTDNSACGTQTLLPMFDSCEKIAIGQSWSFKFDNIGTWKYHNHSNSSHFGTIVVE